MRQRLHRLLNRGLPPERTITLAVAWPLLILPILLVGQLLTPHPVWMTLLVVFVGIYGFGYWWVRELASGVDLERRRQGTLLVAGDRLEEEFTLINRTRLPIVWAEFVDLSDMPGYQPSRIVSTGAATKFRWRAAVDCKRRGVYHLGPSRLFLADLFNLFTLELNFSHIQQVLIYPRVLQLPTLLLPRGQAGGEARQRRPLMGTIPAASVRDYRPGDALRQIHWRTTARQGQLMTREAELEPSGDVWIAVDLNLAAHSGEGEQSTLEYAIVLAASLTAGLLDASDRRAVGLLAVSGGTQAGGDGTSPPPSFISNSDAVKPNRARQAPGGASSDEPDDEAGATTNKVLWVPPLAGPAQLWHVLAALAPAEPGRMPLGELLRRVGPSLGHRRTLIVITAELQPSAAAEGGSAPTWPAELVRLRNAGLAGSALLVSGPDRADAALAMRQNLALLNIPSEVLPVDAKLPPLLTYRRTRTVVRTTPTGGVVTYEVEEEVG